MKQWMAAACTVAAAALVAGTAGTAAAQYPGTNGDKVLNLYDGSNTPCFGFNAVAFSYAPNGWQAALVDDSQELWVEDVNNCEAVPLGYADPSGVAWSPDSRQLAVGRGGDIVVLDAATGSQLRNLTPNTGGTSEKDPTWNAKRGTIAYRASDGIRVRPAGGGASTLIGRGGSVPDFSPDGTKVAYINSAGTIVYADASTGASVKSTYMRASGRSLAWSPDGTQLLFTAPDLATGQQYCAAGTAVGKITWRERGWGFCQTLAWGKA